MWGSFALSDRADGFHAAHNEKMLIGGEFMRDIKEGHEKAVLTQSDDIQAVTRADIQINDRFAEPELGRDDLIKGTVRPQIKIIKDIIGGLIDGEPNSGLLLRENNLVCTAAAEELRLALIIGLAEDALRAKLLELIGYLKADLQACANADKAGVKVLDTEGLENVGICTVAYLGAGGEGNKIAYRIGVDIGNDKLTAHVCQRAAEMMAKGSGSDD